MCSPLAVLPLARRRAGGGTYAPHTTADVTSLAPPRAEPHERGEGAESGHGEPVEGAHRASVRVWCMADEVRHEAPPRGETPSRPRSSPALASPRPRHSPHAPASREEGSRRVPRRPPPCP